MIRTATAADLRDMLNWAAAEGWNPGLDDAAPFLAADPQGFFVSTQQGAPVACISVVNHSAAFAFLGFYICHPDWRGRGLGLALWRHALRHAGDRTVGLDGVVAQQQNYAASGFVPAGATRRLEGRRAGLDSCPKGIAPMVAADVAALHALDTAAFGVVRPAFLDAWLTRSETRRTVVLHGQDGPAGFATARLCRHGAKIGPVVAADADRAQALIAAAADTLGADRAVVDVPDMQPDLQTALRAGGFAETFATARMYRGPAPICDGTGQAVATLELG